MDIQQYIASGILEDYVLNLLDDNERQQVEQYADEYPEIRQEISDLEDSLATFAQMNGVPLSSRLTDSILDEIDALSATSTSEPTPTREQSRSNIKPWMALIPVIALLLLALYLFFHNQQLEGQLQTLQSELAISNNSLETTNQKLEDCENFNGLLINQLNILRDQNNQSVPLNSTASSPDPNAIAYVHYNEINNTIFLEIESLPAPPPGKQYQLWAIMKNDKGIVSMDVFDLPDATRLFISRKYIANVAEFAISLEDAGGSDGNPDFDAIYLRGAV